MLAAFKIFPLLLHILVALQLKVGLGFLISVGIIGRDKIGKKQSVHTLALVFGLDRHQEQVHDIGFSA